MTITAKVVADSAYIVYGKRKRKRLTTFVLRYPRFIHAEFMTHRVFSRNASSSRAIPVAKMIQAIKDDPAMPVYWGKNQSGMQAAEELSAPEIEDMKGFWLSARNEAIRHAEEMLSRGLHKQIANRILEPWMHIEVVCTANQWANFYALRDHPNAQPEMQVLAKAMFEAHMASQPEILLPGLWHLPFVSEGEQEVEYGTRSVAKAGEYLCKVSAARCARVSYLKHDGTQSTPEEDLALFERLMGGNPKHASPTEHQAKVPEPEDTVSDFMYPSNFGEDWVQFRKTIPGETVLKYRDFE